MDTPDELLRETALYVESLFGPDLPGRNDLLNYSSTVRLVQTCSILCTGSDLGKQDAQNILLAAWFEYTGALNDPENFQSHSAENAIRYFAEKGLSRETTEEIRSLILATRHPRQPLSLKEQILCDADNARTGKGHIYFSSYARKIFDKQKEKNKGILKENLPLSKNDASLNDSFKPERGVETLFRNTSRNQMQLIRLADYKANLVISINSIIISVVISLLIVQLKSNQYLELPTLIMILTNVFTILIAVSATRPRIRFTTKSSDYRESADNNQLYHGNFDKMSFEQFNRTIKETMVSTNNLYDSLIRDIYHQGNLLNLKFKRINLAYSVFVVGLLLSIISFVVAFLLYGQAK